MTQEESLADFLLARIEEDQVRATLRDIHAHDCDSIPAVGFEYTYPCDCGTPERWLAECEAKRQIVALLDMAEDQFQNTHLGAANYADVARAQVTRDALLRVVQFLALPYAEHPAFRQEWKP